MQYTVGLAQELLAGKMDVLALEHSPIVCLLVSFSNCCTPTRSTEWDCSSQLFSHLMT